MPLLRGKHQNINARRSKSDRMRQSAHKVHRWATCSNVSGVQRAWLSAPGREYTTLVITSTSTPSSLCTSGIHGALCAMDCTSCKIGVARSSRRSKRCLPRAATSWKVKISLLCTAMPAFAKAVSTRSMYVVTACRHRLSWWARQHSCWHGHTWFGMLTDHAG